jgi:hypothetical protein
VSLVEAVVASVAAGLVEPSAAIPDDCDVPPPQAANIEADRKVKVMEREREKY